MSQSFRVPVTGTPIPVGVPVTGTPIPVGAMVWMHDPVLEAEKRELAERELDIARREQALARRKAERRVDVGVAGHTRRVEHTFVKDEPVHSGGGGGGDEGAGTRKPCGTTKDIVRGLHATLAESSDDKAPSWHSRPEPPVPSVRIAGWRPQVVRSGTGRVELRSI